MLKIDNKVLKINGGWLKVNSPGSSLPPYTLRLKFTEGVTPTFSKGTGVQVSSSPNIWDLTYENNDWKLLLRQQTSLLEVIDANSTGVTNMASMFSTCSSLTTLSLFDTSSVTDMEYMFNGCTSLPSVPLFDTSNVTIMYGMFYGCTSLTNVPLFDTSKVIEMPGMFNGCSSLTSVPLFNTSNVTMMSDMFNRCTSLTSIPLFNTSNVIYMDNMFSRCTSLTSILLYDTYKVTNMRGMFYQCYNVQTGALALYQQASSQDIPPSNHSGTFTDCGRDTTTGAAELAQIPSDWK